MTKISSRLLLVASLFTCTTCLTLSTGSLTGGGSSSNRAAELQSITSWLYQLQNIDPDDVADSEFDLAVIDYSEDGSDEEAFSVAEVTAMKGSGDTEKIVLAYLNIGEAEDYRYYFDANADYIDEENPDWPGNYKVHYWESEWQDVIDSYIDRLIAAGFDGAYLDVIDAYEYYAPDGDSGLDRESAASDMVDFVIHIAEYAREQDEDFLIIPQNGAFLPDDSERANEYYDVIDGIGAEDTFYLGLLDENNSLNVQSDVIDALGEFINQGKIVLSVDYLTDSSKVNDFYERAEAEGFIPYATVRDLDEFTINEGHEP